ncbi:transaldolase family protein [Streptomyces sp. DSM 3412]|uniref:Transaldolase n=1 Tax=Streptomyces gottesmaniae TaxID=3075518 RepID=A0ABU2Z7P5_9ACTN|nr:transaldolase family protein [Streptomyces sp. DSM 3412]MDT0572619.1 transaldolase family protein [Streptomyces sp. DSM 3412]
MGDERRGTDVPGDGSVLRSLAAEGVSVWLAGVGRPELVDGSLRTWVADAYITGVVLSASAMTRELRRHGDHAYLEQLGLLARRRASPEEIVRALSAYDARWACDLLAPVHEAAEGLDGWVCAELDARLADDGPSTLEEVRALALAVNRPNLLVTVAATDAGLDVVRACAAEGIGVYVAPLHSVERYGEVLDAGWEGLERAHRAGRTVRGACVAALDVAAVEAAVDRRLGGPDDSPDAAGLRGRTALALARVAYDLHERGLDSCRWRTLRHAGARPQRLVWSGASRGDDVDSDEPDTGVRHVEEIVAWRTTHLLSPRAVAEAARRARPRGDSLSGEAPAAHDTVAALRRRGIDLGRLGADLDRLRLRQRVRDRAELLDAVRDTPCVREYL